MTKSEEVLDALSDVFTCHCGRRYFYTPARVIAVCKCGVNWGWVMPGQTVIGEYLSRDRESGWSSWGWKLMARSSDGRVGNTWTWPAEA